MKLILLLLSAILPGCVASLEYHTRYGAVAVTRGHDGKTAVAVRLEQR